jgi:hypothetical protein
MVLCLLSSVVVVLGRFWGLVDEISNIQEGADLGMICAMFRHV